MSSARRRSAGPPPRAKGMLDQLERSFLHALRSGEGEAAPAALLWADADQQWAALLARLQAALPHLFVLGAYDASSRTGPAIWLRCVVERVLAHAHAVVDHLDHQAVVALVDVQPHLDAPARPRSPASSRSSGRSRARRAASSGTSARCRGYGPRCTPGARTSRACCAPLPGRDAS